MIRDGLREVWRVLLEADVNYLVTREFVERVQERAVGGAVPKSVSPGQQIVKFVYDEPAALLADKAPAGEEQRKGGSDCRYCRAAPDR